MGSGGEAIWLRRCCRLLCSHGFILSSSAGCCRDWSDIFRPRLTTNTASSSTSARRLDLRTALTSFISQSPRGSASRLRRDMFRSSRARKRAAIIFSASLPHRVGGVYSASAVFPAKRRERRSKRSPAPSFWRGFSSLSNPLVLEAAELETWTQAFSFASLAVREARQREQEALRRIKAHLLVQVRTKERLSGILSLSLRRGQFPYSVADKETLMSV